MIVLSCNNLYKSFGIDSILENICFSVNEGDKIGIIGVNGTGKTTLMKIISGEYGYDEGDIYTSKDCEIGYLEQNTNFHSNNTILEEVLEVFKPLIDIQEIGYEKNMGPGYARQYGIDHTNNEYITFIDADDTFYEACSLGMLSKPIKDTTAKFVISPFIQIGKEVGQMAQFDANLI